MVAPQPSLAVGELNDGVSGQNIVALLPTPLNTGGVRSLVHVTVLETVAVLPQPSSAVHVLVCDKVQLLVCAAPSADVRAGVPQTAVAVAEPNAALISEALGLQPKVNVVPFAVMVGGEGAVSQVTLLEVVAVLPQASVAANVLVWVMLQLVVDWGPSLKVTVGMLQASVALAVPSAALRSEALGLQPSDNVVPLAVIVGGVRSEVQLTVLEVVAVLPQASAAVNVLI